MFARDERLVSRIGSDPFKGGHCFLFGTLRCSPIVNTGLAILRELCLICTFFHVICVRPLSFNFPIKLLLTNYCSLLALKLLEYSTDMGLDIMIFSSLLYMTMMAERFYGCKQQGQKLVVWCTIPLMSSHSICIVLRHNSIFRSSSIPNIS